MGKGYEGVDVLVMGRLITNDGPTICKHCGGDRGWRQKKNVVWHMGCGKKQ